jgi:hypothetical protein
MPKKSRTSPIRDHKNSHDEIGQKSTHQFHILHREDQRSKRPILLAYFTSRVNPLEVFGHARLGLHGFLSLNWQFLFKFGFREGAYQKTIDKLEHLFNKSKYGFFNVLDEDK